MPFAYFNPFQPRLAPEGESSSGAGSTSAGQSGLSGSSGGAGADGGGEEDRPFTLKDFEKYRAESEKRFKVLNDELKDRRHAARREAEPPKEGAGKGEERQDQGSGYSREDARADRRLEGVFTELEDAGVSRDAIEDMEAAAESMSAKDRLSYAAAIKQAYALGREAGSKGGSDREDNGGDSRPGGRRHGGGTNGRRERGGEPPAKSRGSVGTDLTWQEYLEAKKDPKRKAEIDELVESGQLDLQAIRARDLEDRNRSQQRAQRR